METFIYGVLDILEEMTEVLRTEAEYEENVIKIERIAAKIEELRRSGAPPDARQL